MQHCRVRGPDLYLAFTKLLAFTSDQIGADVESIRTALIDLGHHDSSNITMSTMQGSCIGFVDELFKFKLGDEVSAHPATDEYIQLLLDIWLRMFGPMIFLAVDSECALASIEIASACDKLGIQRILDGSDPGASKRRCKHTSTGLVEKRVDLTKSTMRKNTR